MHSSSYSLLQNAFLNSASDFFLSNNTHQLPDFPSGSESWSHNESNHGQQRSSATKVIFDKIRYWTANSFAKTDWQWPDRPVIFISDAHADAEAFEQSLLASGAISSLSNGEGVLPLTELGRQALFVIGGDCLDKGPSNLALLRSINRLKTAGASIKLLAGNHDLRLLMGLLALESPENKQIEHMFVRMGKKVIPLFKEIFDEYVKSSDWLDRVPSESECREQLFPSPQWYESFPGLAKSHGINRKGVNRELKKMREKSKKFEKYCSSYGMTLQQIYAAVQTCRKLFLSKEGEFYWFFDSMELAHREGAFLFVHAGLDDQVSKLIAKQGVAHVNQQFKSLLKNDQFGFYYSSIANTFRTKYRKSDRPLTVVGVRAVQKSGIKAVVRGHVSQITGQSLSVQNGLLHFDSDVTLDRNSRKKDGLKGVGYGFTCFLPNGEVVAVSRDYPRAKIFRPHSNSFLRYRHAA